MNQKKGRAACGDRPSKHRRKPGHLGRQPPLPTSLLAPHLRGGLREQVGRLLALGRQLRLVADRGPLGLGRVELLLEAGRRGVGRFANKLMRVNPRITSRPVLTVCPRRFQSPDTRAYQRPKPGQQRSAACRTEAGRSSPASDKRGKRWPPWHLLATNGGGETYFVTFFTSTGHAPV